MRPSHIRVFILVLVSLAFLGWAIPTAANFVIEYNWWKEVAQVDTWFSMLWYSIAPVAVGALVAFIALYVAHARGLHFAGIRQRDYPLYFRLVPVALAVIAMLLASASIDFWTVMRFFGSRGLAALPTPGKTMFSHTRLPFYLFDLPFYSDLLGFLFVVAILCAMLFWITARGWQLFERVRYGRLIDGSSKPIDIGDYLRLPGATRTAFLPHHCGDSIVRFCGLGLSGQL